MIDNQNQILQDAFDDYQSVGVFLNEHNHLNPLEFDYAIMNYIDLFATKENYSFDEIELICDRIIAVLPAIKRIFARPIIHLKDNFEILPVESVHLINNQTIIHASTHSELFSDIEDNKIKPNKLLTINSQDNYSIYENVVFISLIKQIMSFVKRNTQILKDLLYANDSLQFNLLERLNHLQYYLAIGKLHTGYIRNFEKYYAIAERCLEKLSFIDNSIKIRLKSPLYKNVKIPKGEIKLHKSNILKMHKDYHRIYNLFVFFQDNHQLVSLVEDIASDNYFYYCEMLIIFALLHFNFTLANDIDIDFYNPHLVFKFKNWLIILETKIKNELHYISLEIEKEVKKTIFILPFCKMNYKAINNTYDNDIVFTDKEDDSGIFININNINSFQRIQQLILKLMLEVDSEKNICPFCGYPLTKIVNRNNSYDYYCKTCRLSILDIYCPENKKDFFATSITNLKLQKIEGHLKENDFNRYKEKVLYYRNITDIDELGNIICPYCHKIHR